MARAPEPRSALKARVSFGEGVSCEQGEQGMGCIPRAIAQELRADGTLCNLPPPSEDDIAKMQWMGDLEATPDSDDDDGAAERGGGADARAARRVEKLARRKVEGLRFDFDGRLVDPARAGAAEACARVIAPWACARVAALPAMVRSAACPPPPSCAGSLLTRARWPCRRQHVGGLASPRG
jgi:hypothetical protein